MTDSGFARSLMCGAAFAVGVLSLGTGGAPAQAATGKHAVETVRQSATGQEGGDIEKRRSRAETARHFVENITKPALDLGIFSNDLSVWTASAGYFSREQYLENLSTARSIWREPLEFSISLTLERHNCVVIEATSSGVLFTGDHYGNEYLFVIDFDADEKISNVREYYDAGKIESVYRPAVLKWKSGQAR